MPPTGRYSNTDRPGKHSSFLTRPLVTNADSSLSHHCSVSPRAAHEWRTKWTQVMLALVFSAWVEDGTSGQHAGMGTAAITLCLSGWVVLMFFLLLPKGSPEASLDPSALPCSSLRQHYMSHSPEAQFKTEIEQAGKKTFCCQQANKSQSLHWTVVLMINFVQRWN